MNQTQPTALADKIKRWALYIWRAFGWKRSIIVFAATSLGAVLKWLASETWAPWWLIATPSWAVIVVVLAALTAVFLAVRIVQLESEKEPQLFLAFDDHDPRRFRQVTSDATTPCLFVLLLPRLRTRKNLKGCTGHLTAIRQQRSENEGWTDTSFGTALQLRWQDQRGRTGFDKQLLYADENVRQYLDVFQVFPRGDATWIRIERLPQIVENEINMAHRLRLQVSVFAEDEDASGARATTVLEVEKTQDWSSPIVRQTDHL